MQQYLNSQKALSTAARISTPFSTAKPTKNAAHISNAEGHPAKMARWEKLSRRATKRQQQVDSFCEEYHKHKQDPHRGSKKRLQQERSQEREEKKKGGTHG
ncbi:hypothetical protein B7494_g2457 [Chlorociboria aeruginascens]|nr:hypothetical protein B7494_g2457 [Chlorociboria aeruginascens]